MNDRDLSRGKTIYGPRPHFVTGHYVSVPRPMIVSTKTRIGGGWDADDVDPATIGRCTGLRDVNGTLIFEGDIVYIHDYECRAEVYWDSGAWMLYFGEGSTSDEYAYDFRSVCEIIGNIHDNPELLAGAERSGDE